MNACIEEICSKSTQETQCCLSPTDPLHQCSRRLVCWSQLSQSYYQAGSVKIRRTLPTNLRTGADATMRHSHISGGHEFSHCHDVRSIASDLVSAECGEFLGTLIVGTCPAGDGCRTSWEVVVKGREQHNRTWLIVHWAVDSVGCHRRG